MPDIRLFGEVFKNGKAVHVRVAWKASLRTMRGGVHKAAELVFAKEGKT